MTYNKSQIMKAAWTAYKASAPYRFCRATFIYRLRCAWAEARSMASILADLPGYRARLEAEITRLTYSDALGSTARLNEARRELAALPLAA